MAHSSGWLIWRTYGHMFEAARLVPAVPTAEEPCLAGRRRKRETGFEPATSSLEGSRSSQLSYSRAAGQA